MQSVISLFPGPVPLLAPGAETGASGQDTTGVDFAALLVPPDAPQSESVTAATELLTDATRDPGFAALWSLAETSNASPGSNPVLTPVFEGEIREAETKLPPDQGIGRLPRDQFAEDLTVAPPSVALPVVATLADPKAKGIAVTPSTSVSAAPASVAAILAAVVAPVASARPEAKLAGATVVADPLATVPDRPPLARGAESIAESAPLGGGGSNRMPLTNAPQAARGTDAAAAPPVTGGEGAPASAVADEKLLAADATAAPTAAIAAFSDRVVPKADVATDGVVKVPVTDPARLVASVSGLPTNAPSQDENRAVILQPTPDASDKPTIATDGVKDPVPEKTTPTLLAENSITLPAPDVVPRRQPVSLWEAAFPAMPAQAAGLVQAAAGKPAPVTPEMSEIRLDKRADLNADIAPPVPEDRTMAKRADLTSSVAPTPAIGTVVPEALPEPSQLPLDLPPDEALVGLGSHPGPLGPYLQAASAQALPANALLPPMVAQIVGGLSSAKPGVTEIALSPEELGRVTLKMQADAQDPDRMVVMLSFDRPETLELFRRHADQLADVIRAVGYSGVDIGFAQGGHAGDDSPTGFTEGGSDDGPAWRPDLPLPLTPDPIARPADAGLYLRL
jgi:Flagellar hook-length control protein FliK